MLLLSLHGPASIRHQGDAENGETWVGEQSLARAIIDRCVAWTYPTVTAVLYSDGQPPVIVAGDLDAWPSDDDNAERVLVGITDITRIVDRWIEESRTEPIVSVWLLLESFTIHDLLGAGVAHVRRTPAAPEPDPLDDVLAAMR